MKRRWATPLLALLVAAAGAALGWAAGPTLSRAHPDVKTAERVRLEETRGLAERTLRSEAFRAGKSPIGELYARAETARRSFRVGGALFGLWCGLVGAWTAAGVMAERRREEYEADRAHCLACARCFWSCPVERKQTKARKEAEETP